MSKIKLLALDLDGTLLTHDKQISTENKVAIKQAQAAGVHVVITTGRPLKAIEHILKELDLLVASEYSITFNGGLVQRNNGEILSKKTFSWEWDQPIMGMLFLSTVQMSTIMVLCIQSAFIRGQGSSLNR